MLLEDRPINYALLAEAVRYYKVQGFEQIEVPWIVSGEASLETAPTEHDVYVSNRDEHFVGSAEQSFIQLMMYDPDKLESNKDYFAITPCFRRDRPSEKYSRWFMKLELFCRYDQNIYVDGDANIGAMDIALWYMDRAKDCFKHLSNRSDITHLDNDLMCGDLELGSYGVRQLSVDDNICWVFGTGLALPRFQLILNK